MSGWASPEARHRYNARRRKRYAEDAEYRARRKRESLDWQSAHPDEQRRWHRNYRRSGKTNAQLNQASYIFNRNGGKCDRCGSELYLATTDFHHAYGPKSFGVSEGAWTTKRLHDALVEAEKCQVLCRNCHGITHAVGVFADLTIKEYFERFPERLKDVRPLPVEPIEEEPCSSESM